MLRRQFVLGSVACVASAAPALAFGIDYRKGLVQERLAAGETLFLDFAADWCSTCATQERAIKRIRDSNAAYDAITFIRVDWDEFGNSTLARNLRVPRRSTLVVLSGDQELGRIVAGTRLRDIQALMDVALKAAQKGT